MPNPRYCQDFTIKPLLPLNNKVKGLIIAGVFILTLAAIFYQAVVLHKTTEGLIGSSTNTTSTHLNSHLPVYLFDKTLHQHDNNILVLINNPKDIILK